MHPIRRFLVALCVGMAALPCQAGALYGTVRGERGPLGVVKVLLACPGFASPSRRTEATSDNGGSFSLRVPGNGKCEMRVQRGNQLGAPFDVFLSDNAIRFDFVVGSNLQKLR